MAEQQILVKTPLTSDGNMPIMGTDGKQVYSESILGSAAKAILEKRNQALPTPLKVIIESYTDPASIPLINTVKKETNDKRVS